MTDDKHISTRMYNIHLKDDGSVDITLTEPLSFQYKFDGKYNKVPEWLKIGLDKFERQEFDEKEIVMYIAENLERDGRPCHPACGTG